MNVNRIDTATIKGDELQILFFGDLHLGSKDCDIKSIENQIEWIKKQKDLLVIMMGDTINCALRGSVGAGSYDDIMNPSEQIDYAIKLLEPIKDKIVGMHNGNHPARVYNATTVNPEKFIATSIGVPYLGDTCFHHIRFGKQTYIFFSAHGSTGSATAGGALNTCMKYATPFNADLYAMGHTHQLGSYSQESYEVNKQNKTMDIKKKYFVLTGGYLNWKGSYAETKNYAPLKIGSAKAILSKNKFDIHIRT